MDGVPYITIGNALRFALRIVQGRIILNFGVQKRPQAFLNPIFTSGVVERNGICSAAFCESAVLREYPFRHCLRQCHLPQGDGFCGGGQLYDIDKRRPLGGAVAQRLKG